MGIVETDIAKVRSASDIVAIVGQYTQLRRVGRRFTGLCPFHSERTGSFSVNAEEGLYYCFGCGQKGDVITFVREKEQLDFVGAVEWLANKTQIQLSYTSTSESNQRRRRKDLTKIVGSAANWYHERLLSDPEAGSARSYLRSRGYDTELVKRFKIGWSPDGWDRLAKGLDISAKDLADSGLGFVNRRGSRQDAFRKRIMFPIFDAQGDAVGFGGRKLPGDDDPAKYKNSSESAVYHKSSVLYGLNWAKSDIVTYDQVVICEGYTDVIGYAAAGIGHAVATCGTALTEDHVKMLKRFTNKMVLSFDADSAGEGAALRFYEWERKYDIEVSVADIPSGSDPGELAQVDPPLLRKSVEEAKPFLSFRVHKLLDQADLTSVEGRARAADDALVIIAEHPEQLVRDEYVMAISSRLRLDEASVRRKLASGPKSNRKIRSVDSKAPVRANKDTAEVEALRLMASDRAAVEPLLVPELFSDSLCETAFHYLVESTTVAEAIGEAGPEVGELLYRVAAAPSESDPVDVAGLLWSAYLVALMGESRVGSDSGLIDSAIVSEHTWMRLKLEDLRDSNSQADTVGLLVDWVSSAPERN